MAKMKARAVNAQRLKRIRQLLDMSQREMADEFMVTSAAIALWETQARQMPGPVLKLIALYEAELGLMETPRQTLDVIATSWISRNAKLSRTLVGATTQLAGGALARVLASDERASEIRRSTQTAIAKQLVDSLGELKGVAMKLGQMLSYLDFAMPKPAQEVLQSLQASAVAMSADVVAEVFLEDMGKTPRQFFEQWSPEPFAAASIGQVHRAVYKGRPVAVKVQYPGVAKAMSADLKSAAVIDKLLAVLFPTQAKGALVEELRERLLSECDYELEAKHQREFAALFGDRVIVPRVELATKRVLVSEFVEAQPFAAFVKTATQAQKNRAGETLFRVAWESIMRHGFFNADPHPGNFLFKGEQVVMLDFGCVKHFDAAFIATWKQLFRSHLEDRRQGVREALTQLQIVPNPDKFDFDYDRRMMHALYEPWLHAEPFRFTSDYVTNTWRKMIVDNENKFRMSVPKDMIFANRLQWGLYAVLALLEAQADWRGIVLDLLYAPGEPRPKPFPRPESRPR